MLQLGSYDLPLVLDLATLKQRRLVTANLAHAQDRRVGHVDDFGNDGRVLRLGGIVSAASAAAQEFTTSAERGYPWAASIEAQPGKLEEISAGKSVEVNGQRFVGPLYVARNSTLYGIAFLSTGADESARAMLASRKKSMSDFQSWAVQMVPNLDFADADAVADLHANFHGRDTATDADRPRLYR